MKTVRDLLKTKGTGVYSIRPNAMVFEALQLMSEKNCGALVVLDEAGRLAGILSERDYARKVALYGKTSHETPVRDIMTERVVCVAPHQTVQDCMALMSGKHIRHLPVLEGDQLTGIISIGDVVKAIINDQAFTIEQLENYISGAR